MISSPPGATPAYLTAVRFVVTGANRGIGLEFVKQLTARGEEVEATVRAPEDAPDLGALVRPGARLRIHRLDVAEDPSVAAFAGQLPSGPVDVLINNAGVSGVKGGEPIDPQDILRVFNVNAVGTLRVVRALLPQLRAGKGKKIVNLTSVLGSIAEASGGRFAYRMSKAALNMATRVLAQDLGGEGFRSVALHPGWVQTRMGGSAAPVPPEQSVRAMLEIIDGLSVEQSGRVFDFQGREIPW
jgi:NAD(P)-dependent dehydrogenase (short-subunit alcohol dehydrogenase family)